MKKIHLMLLISLSLLFLSSCTKKPIYKFTDYMSMNYLYDYLPYTNGQLLLFTDENKTDSCVFTVQEIEHYLFIDSICKHNPMCDCIWGYGIAYVKSTFVDDDTTTYKDYTFSINIDDYSVFDRECKIYYSFAGVYTPIMNDNNILLDDIQSYLLPELIAYDTKNTTEEYAKCVNGIGITMFTDADGKKWYFDSVLSE